VEAERTVVAVSTATDTLQLVAYHVPREVASLHDPAVAPDGSIWYTDMWASCVGRLEDGQIRETRTADPKARPHGITVDPGGVVWHGGHGGIGRVNARDFEALTIPLKGELSPHTVLAVYGVVWFTAQGDSYGWLDPASGEAVVFEHPRLGAAPYGLAAGADDRVWVSGRGSLLAVSALTGETALITLPSAEAEPMRLAVGADGIIWYPDRARGVLGRFDPRTGDITEFPTLHHNGRPRSLAIDSAGRVWYFESATDHLVVFDPTDGSHSGMALRFLGTVIRHMVYDAERSRLVMALGDAGAIAVMQVMEPTF
jgi:virginiamycin B lyase